MLVLHVLCLGRLFSFSSMQPLWGTVDGGGWVKKNLALTASSHGVPGVLLQPVLTDGGGGGWSCSCSLHAGSDSDGHGRRLTAKEVRRRLQECYKPKRLVHHSVLRKTLELSSISFRDKAHFTPPAIDKQRSGSLSEWVKTVALSYVHGTYRHIPPCVCVSSAALVENLLDASWAVAAQGRSPDLPFNTSLLVSLFEIDTSSACASTAVERLH